MGWRALLGDLRRRWRRWKHRRGSGLPLDKRVKLCPEQFVLVKGRLPLDREYPYWIGTVEENGETSMINCSDPGKSRRAMEFLLRAGVPIYENGEEWQQAADREAAVRSPRPGA